MNHPFRKGIIRIFRNVTFRRDLPTSCCSARTWCVGLCVGKVKKELSKRKRRDHKLFMWKMGFDVQTKYGYKRTLKISNRTDEISLVIIQTTVQVSSYFIRRGAYWTVFVDDPHRNSLTFGDVIAFCLLFILKEFTLEPRWANTNIYSIPLTKLIRGFCEPLTIQRDNKDFGRTISFLTTYKRMAYLSPNPSPTFDYPLIQQYF